MPITTLTNLSVPIGGQNAGLLHPKLKYRFRVLFENFGLTSPATELTKQVVSATRPSLDHELITLDVYNSKIYLAGRHTWNPVDITVRDDASSAVQRVLGEQMQRQLDHYNQSSPQVGEDYKFVTKIEILDGGNGAHDENVLESWTLVGCFVKTANYNDLAYADNDVVTIAMNIQYDNAVQDEGIGVLGFGRTTGNQLASGVNSNTGGIGGLSLAGLPNIAAAAPVA